jgi:hypothetical protein
MRLLFIIDRKGFLPVIWERLSNPLKHEGWFGEPTPKNTKKIKHDWMAIHLEKQLPINV